MIISIVVNMNRFKELLKLWFNTFEFKAGEPYGTRKYKCQICHNLVIDRIQVPSSTGLWVCYDCYSYWVEGYKPEELVFKIIKHYREQDL